MRRGCHRVQQNITFPEGLIFILVVIGCRIVRDAKWRLIFLEVTVLLVFVVLLFSAIFVVMVIVGVLGTLAQGIELDRYLGKLLHHVCIDLLVRGLIVMVATTVASTSTTMATASKLVLLLLLLGSVVLLLIIAVVVVVVGRLCCLRFS